MKYNPKVNEVAARLTGFAGSIRRRTNPVPKAPWH